MSESHRKLALELPDLPRWVDTRGLLLSGRCKVLHSPSKQSYLVAATDQPLVAVVGRPPGSLLDMVVGGASEGIELLVQQESIAQVAQALPDWRGEAALIHTLPVGAGQFDLPVPRASDESRPEARIVEEQDRILSADLPAALRRELGTALRVGIPIAACFAAGRPVSFCYPALETETWWDVSVETLEPYRGRGLAGQSFACMEDRMRRLKKRPVWGAVASNAASLRVAAKLGFRRVDELAVFSPPVTEHQDASG